VNAQVEQLISEIVREQLATTLNEIGLSEFVQDGPLFDYLSGNLTNEAINANPGLYNALVKSITLPVNEIALKEAAEMSARQAATLVTGEIKTQIRALGDIISEGLKRGDGPRTISNRLKLVDSLDSVRAKRLDKYIQSLEKMGLKPDDIAKKSERMKQKLLRERRETIARTETRYAQEEAARVQANAAGKQWKRWITSADDRVSEVCRDNQAQGWIKIADTFQGGTNNPPGHPNCRCSCVYRKEDPDDAAKARAQARIDATG
jgi:SPP1 gp7 family putative phage head morphogenesis protein